MAQPLSTAALIPEVRDQIDQIVYGTAADETELQNLGYSKISDEQLAECIESACRFVAVRARAEHIPDLIQYTNGAVPQDAIRLIDDLCEDDGVRARRMAFRSRRTLHASRAASAEFPVFSFADAEFEMDPGGNPQAGWVATPTRASGVDIATLIRERLVSPVVLRASELAFATMQQPILVQLAAGLRQQAMAGFAMKFNKTS